MLRESELLDALPLLVDGDGVQYYLYGDLAYPLGPTLMKPFSSINITPAQQAFNVDMARCRMSVEWGFHKITELFPTLSWHRQQKVLENPVSIMYQVGALLANCHTCLYGSPTAAYFAVRPPTLEEYLDFEQ